MAFGLLGAVLVAIGAVVVVRVSGSPGFLRALGAGGEDGAAVTLDWDEDDWEECNSLAIMSGIYDSASDGISAMTYDHHSETVGQAHRPSSLRVITYGNPSRASEIIAERREAARVGALGECLAALEDSTSGRSVEPVLKGDGSVGWAMIFTWGGRANRREFLTWLDHGRVVNLELIGPEASGTAEWMAEEYRRVTSRITAP